MDAASNVIGMCTRRKDDQPTNLIVMTTMAAMAMLVPMVLSHGRQPALMAPTGSRCWIRKR
jgi:hypothetical protein